MACLIVTGCSRSTSQSEPPNNAYKFLGIADDETSNQGPVGLIGSQAIQVSDVSKVREVPYSDYKEATSDSKVVAEERHDGYIYWAVKEERDVSFENATAWVTVLERFKSRVE